jgi:hypothetical protein
MEPLEDLDSKKTPSFVEVIKMEPVPTNAILWKTTNGFLQLA